MLVADASAVVASLTDDGRVGTAARARLRSERIAQPQGFELEVLSALRGLDLGGKLSARQSARAVRELMELQVERRATTGLARRIWQLRGNLTTYDAAYVALAEQLGCSLITLDRRMSRAPGIRCHVEVLG